MKHKKPIGWGVVLISISFVLVLTLTYHTVLSIGGPLEWLTIEASLEKTHFTNQEKTHEVYVRIKLYNKPDDISIIYASCKLGNDIYCEIDKDSCYLSGDEYECKLYIPSIHYTSSRFYNKNKKQLIISSNEIKLTFLSGDSTRSFTDELEDITIDVVPVCGKYGCESELGENKDTCCLDCGCGEGEFCYTGNKTEGECVSLSQINAVVKIDPKEVACTPFDYANQCGFTEKVEFSQFFGSMYEEYNVLEAGLEYDNRFYYLICENHPEKSYILCPFIIPDMKEIAKVKKNVNVFSSITFLSEDVLRTKNLENSVDVGIVPETQGVNTYLQQKKHLDYELLVKLKRFMTVAETQCDIFKNYEDTDRSYCRHCLLCCQEIPCTNTCGCEWGCSGLCSDELAIYCVCKNLIPHLQNLYITMKKYNELVLGIYSSTSIEELREKIEKIRTLVPEVEKIMSGIKEGCKPTGSVSTPECSPISCSRESGLESHEKLNFAPNVAYNS